MRGWALALLLVGCGGPPPAVAVVPTPAPTLASPVRHGQLAAGYSHGCAIRVDAGVACWGGNGRDQLGNGRLGYAAAAVRAPEVSGAVEIAAGAQTTCVRDGEWRVWCWGDGTTSPRKVVEGALQLAISTRFGCARKRDGSVWCWKHGEDQLHAIAGVIDAVSIYSDRHRVCSRTQAGDVRCDDWSAIAPRAADGRKRPPRVTIGWTNPTDPAAIRSWQKSAKQIVDVGLPLCARCPRVRRCVLSAVGKVICWGPEDGGKTPPGFENVAEITAGHRYLCARLHSGAVRCIGRQLEAELRALYADEPVPNHLIAGIDDAVEIDAGLLHTCARRKSGKVTCWGENYSGQLGNGTTAYGTEPSDVLGVESAVELTTGTAHSCARLGDGSLRCWGWGESGQLGVDEPMGMASELAVPVVGVSGAVELAGGFSHTCARTTRGAVHCWGRATAGGMCTPKALGDTPMECYGTGSACGSILDGRTDSFAVPWRVSGLGFTQSIAEDGSTTCALSDKGVVRCFDSPSRCEETGRHVTDVRVAASVAGAATLGMGGNHSCVTTIEGDVACWGRNRYGQLGDGSKETRKSPRRIAQLSGVEQLALGEAHSCALRKDGRVFCWGFNVSGQLGTGDTVNHLRPVPVRGLADATQLAAGAWHTCAVRRGGGVVCWGENEHGSLGDGTQIDRVEPAPAAHAGAALAIAAGKYRTCAMDSARNVRCWGNDDKQVLSDPVVLP